MTTPKKEFEELNMAPADKPNMDACCTPISLDGCCPPPADDAPC